MEHVLKGLALYDRDKHRSHALTYGGHDPAVCGKGQGALMLWLLGYPDQAARQARDGIGLSETLTHVPSVVHALWWATVAYQLRRDPPAVLNCAKRLLAVSDEHGMSQHRAIGGIMHGWAFAHLSDIQNGLSEMRPAVISYPGTQRSYWPRRNCALAISTAQSLHCKMPRRFPMRLARRSGEPRCWALKATS